MPTRFEKLVEQMLALGLLGRRVEQLAEVPADGLHELDHRRIPIPCLAAEHLDDADAGPVVADGEGVGALQPVLPEGVGEEAVVPRQVGHPQRLVVLEDVAWQPFAPAPRVLGLLLCERRSGARRARPDVAAHQLVIGRERPQRGHVPAEPPPQGREQPFCRRVVDWRVRQQFEQFRRQFRPALQPPIVPGPEDAEDDAACDRMVQHAQDQVGLDVGAVRPLDDRRQPPPHEIGCLLTQPVRDAAFH